MQLIKRFIAPAYASTEKMYAHYAKDAPAPTSTGTAFVRMDNVLERESVAKALADLEKTFPAAGGYEKERVHFWSKNGIWKQVTFNADHEPEDFELEGHTVSVSKVARQAVSRFGSELKLEGPQQVAVAFIKYSIPRDGLAAGGWHTDSCASWTMISMLSDPEDGQAGWTGGDLLRSTYFFQQQKPMGFYQPQDSLEQHEHRQYGALLFHNHSTLHCVDAMQPRGEQATRTILQVALWDGGKNGMFDTPYNRLLEVEEKLELDVGLIRSRDIRA